MNIRSACKKIQDREWATVTACWLDFLPAIGWPGTAPDPGVTELVANAGIEGLDIGGTPVEDIPGLRQNTLWEAIFLFQKAAHVLRATEHHVRLGYRSWSLFEGYHAALMSAKATLGLLGVATPQPEGRQLVVDLFPQPKRSRRSRSPGRRFKASGYVFNAYKMPPLQHSETWQLVHRILRVSVVNVWSPEAVEHALHTSPERISRIRNRLLYNNVFWPLNDIVDPSLDVGFGIPVADVPISEEDEAFLLRYAFVMCYLAFALFHDLSIKAPVLRRDLEFFLLRDWQDQSPLFWAHCKGFDETLGAVGEG